jgi:hypothetical protein
MVVSPLISSIQEIMDKELYKNDTPDNMPVMTQIKQLITAIGSISKGMYGSFFFLDLFCSLIINSRIPRL